MLPVLSLRTEICLTLLLENDHGSGDLKFWWKKTKAMVYSRWRRSVKVTLKEVNIFFYCFGIAIKIEMEIVY